MTPIGYLISVTHTPTNTDAILRVRKITEGGLSFSSSGNGTITTTLFVSPSTKRNTQELIRDLEAIPDFSNIKVAPFSEPMSPAELSHVRQIFEDLGKDTSKVSNEELSLFLKSKLERQYRYYIDPEQKQGQRGKFFMVIKRLEEHPNFSPDWLKPPPPLKERWWEEEPEIVTNTVTVTVSREVEPPPPPPPPHENLAHMTKVEIKKWIIENDPRGLKEEDIEIDRTSERVSIKIIFDYGEELFSYPLK